MSVTAPVASARLPVPALHDRFTPIHATVVRVARGTFRRVRHSHDREDLLADAVLVAWRRFLTLVTEAVPVEPLTLARQAVEAAHRHFYRDPLAIG